MDQHDLNIINVRYDRISSSIKLNNDTFIFYAHPGELLDNHLIKTLKIFKQIVNYEILKEFHKKLFDEGSIDLGYEEFKNIIYDSIIFHDYGKLSFKFQEKLNKKYLKFGSPQNEFLKKYGMDLFNNLDSDHSFTGALLFLSKYLNIEESNKVFILILSYIILGHHTILRDINSELDFTYKFGEKDNEKRYSLTYYLLLNYLDLSKSLDDYKIKNLQDFQYVAANKIKRLKTGNFSFLYSYLYSLIITSDVIASSNSNKELDDSVFSKSPINRINNDLLKKMEQIFYSMPYNTNLDKNINNISSINDLRLKMLQEASKNLKFGLKNKNNHIFFLNMPTGAGKTNTSMKLALDLISNTDANRIIYAMPFINIIEQNYNVIRDNYGLNENKFQIRKLYSGTECITQKEDENFKTHLIFQDQTFNFPVICTTFVSLFNSLIEVNKKNKYMLNSLTNSIIILDEIQSLPVKNWNSLYYLINELALNYNIYFIIMSATIPNFDKLKLDKNNEMNYPKINLINNPDVYFNHHLFNRTEIKDYKSLNITSDYFLEYYLDKIKYNFSIGYTKGLIVLNTIKSSRKIFDLLKEYTKELNFTIDLLNGSLLSLTRNEIIQKINNINENEQYILVSTQSIEAGVDVSFDFVFRDFTTLDSIEQVRGRCNRSGELYKKFKDIKQKGNVYLTEIKQNKIPIYSYIYDKTEKMTRVSESKKILKEKLDYKYLEMESYYDNVSKTINNLNDTNEDNFILTDRENIQNWIHFNYSKLNDSEMGINIIDNNFKQYSIFVTVKLPILKSKYYNKSIQDMDDKELNEKYKNDIKNFNFSENEIRYIKNLNNEGIVGNYVDGNIILEEYINKHNNFIENREFGSYKIFKKEISSILFKFIFHVVLSKDDLQIQIESLDFFSFFYILPAEKIGEEDFNLYSLKRGFNYGALTLFD